MIRKTFVFMVLFFSLFFPGNTAFANEGVHPYVLRGIIYVDLEPIFAGHVDEEYPLDVPTAALRALQEVALLYSAMIYGWAFHYEVGERARGIQEVLELNPVAIIPFGDPGLRVTDTDLRGSQLWVWTDFHLTPAQQSRLQAWRMGTIRNAQAVGFGPAFLEENPGWLAVKNSALEDAARVALRTMLRGSERNRPREVTGFISLASFPRFFIDSGRWAASARFRVRIMEIVPFSVH